MNHIKQPSTINTLRLIPSSLLLSVLDTDVSRSLLSMMAASRLQDRFVSLLDYAQRHRKKEEEKIILAIKRCWSRRRKRSSVNVQLLPCKKKKSLRRRKGEEYVEYYFFFSNREDAIYLIIKKKLDSEKRKYPWIETRVKPCVNGRKKNNIDYGYHIVEIRQFYRLF